MAETNTHEHLYDLVKDFDTAMLVTKDAGGKMHARPMSVAELRPDADAYSPPASTLRKSMKSKPIPKR